MLTFHKGSPELHLLHHHDKNMPLNTLKSPGLQALKTLLINYSIVLTQMYIHVALVLLKTYLS